MTLLIIACLYLGFSLITFAAYAWDKRAARRKHRRVSEPTLHVLSLLGGWPGALVAQQMVRHKTKKLGFQLLFWLTVAANCLTAALIFRSA